MPGTSRNHRRVNRPLSAWLLFTGVAVGSLGTCVAVFTGGENPYGPPKAMVLSLGVAIGLCGLALSQEGRRSAIAGIRRSRLAWALGAIVALAGVSSVFAYDPRQALIGGYPDYLGFVTLLGFAGLGVCWIAVWARPDGPRFTRRAVTFATLVVLLFGLLQRTGGWRPAVRVASLLGNPANLGVFLLLGTPFVAWEALSDDAKPWRVAGIAGVVLSVPILFWTLSRGAWVGAIAALVVAAVMLVVSGGIKIGRRRGLLGVGIALLVVAATALLTPGFAARAARTFDISSPTAKWRLETWQATTRMVMARPLTGWGIDNYRYVYRLFEPRGQVSQSSGYDIVESAHNVVADAGASLGILGVVLVGCVVGLSAWRLVRIARARGPWSPTATALAASLGGAFVALQFHYVTMDTGALLAMVFAGVVCAGGPAEPEPERPLSTVRWAAIALSAVYALIAMALALLVAADSVSFVATGQALHGGLWADTSAEFATARALAPWEPRLDRDAGDAAAAVLMHRFDATAFRDGRVAFDRAIRVHPGDPVLAAERANLILSAGLASRDAAVLAEAEQAFADAQAMDPNSGVIAIGGATAVLALGRAQSAIPQLKAGLALSPQYDLGWENLARAYDQIGDESDAVAARARAASLQ
jgi:hypothetical protein